jgi:hypothetical protein
VLFLQGVIFDDLLHVNFPALCDAVVDSQKLGWRRFFKGLAGSRSDKRPFGFL